MFSSSTFKKIGLTNLSEISYRNIGSVKIKSRKRFVIGTLAGAGIGLAVGIIAVKTEPPPSGFMSPTHNTTKVSFTILGTGLGAALGSIRFRIPINGDLENFKRSREKLKKLSYQ